MPLPNLVLAGFPKCGTTSVADTLVRHPQVCGSFPDLRTRYFTPLLYDAAAALRPVAEYADHYRRCRGERVLLDNGPVWVYGRQRVADRVREVLDDPRILVMMREPVARTASYLAWKKRHGEIDQRLTLADYAAHCRQLGAATVDTAGLNPYSGLHGSDYATYLAPWLDVFGDAVRVAYLDDLRDPPGELYERLAEWLEISPLHFREAAPQVSNSARQVRSPRLERGIRRMGRAAQPLARRTPVVYRAMRDTARRINMTDPSVAPVDDTGMRESLLEFFAPGLRELAGLVCGRELLGTPDWLAGW